MRFTAYAGTSMALASAVIVRALHERANFYSACVYLAQSNACLMVLTNVALLGVCTTMLGLQRLFYGPLRPIEVEQLYEKAWFAITETCLAMTIFRDEVGGWFLVMFVCLLIGKVWGWIGEGRVEILEQQPPSNPRLFHARLSISLIISTLFNIAMLRYSIRTILHHARPNMMVMFAFEFAVLTVTSMSTAARYTLSLHEASVIREQIKDRRAQMRRERDMAQSQANTTESSITPESPTHNSNADDDIDLLDIDVSGWEEKGRWVFYLDLTTDILKLILYLTFFCVLCMFYGMPIHIIRDVALTIRSFYKRITDFVRYRQATRDMNARYPDATAGEIAREDVCIICREDMRPWRDQTTLGPGQADPARTDSTPAAVDERLRPKKLPCGHILHFACLRSWLERQQNCPTCRRPVLVTANVRQAQESGLANQHGQGRGQGHNNQPPAHIQPDGQQPIVAQNVFNLGPFRIAFGARQRAQAPQHQANNIAHPPILPGLAPAFEQNPRMANTLELQRQAVGSQNRTLTHFNLINVQPQLYHMEQHLLREINGLRIQQDQLHLVRALQSELNRLRATQTNTEVFPTSRVDAMASQSRSGEAMAPAIHIGQGFVSNSQQGQQMAQGHPNLPTGLTLPPGWTLLPLHRISNQANNNPSGANLSGASHTDSSGHISDSELNDTPVDAAATGQPQVAHSRHRETDEAPSARLQKKSDKNNGNSRALDGASKSADTDTSSATEDIGLVATQKEEASSENHDQPIGGIKAALSDTATARLPRWGSDTIQSQQSEHEPKMSSNSHLEQSHKSSEESAGADASSRKGKGKASTVEDSIEDCD